MGKFVIFQYVRAALGTTGSILQCLFKRADRLEIIKHSLLIMMVFFLGYSKLVMAKDKEQLSLPYFSVQFYRITLNKAIAVEDITLKHHFYVVSGTTSNPEAVFHLSRNLLQSNYLIPFEIIDTLVKINDNKFKIFLKTTNYRPKSTELFVSIIAPEKKSHLNKEMHLKGNCFPNGRRVNIFGDVNKLTICKDEKWSITLDLSGIKTIYLFAHISDSKGRVFLDGHSVVKR
jgi:hypothetical protein